MSYNIKHRPELLKHMYGNSNVISSLKKILQDAPHAFLFTGPSGCGKTTLARIVAKKLKADALSLNEFNVADVRGIDTVREIINNSKYQSVMGGAKVYILDEAHQITVDAQNAFLKVIEDAPEHVYFIFCSTNPEKIIPTLRNRCVHYEVERLSRSEAKELLQYVIKQERIKVDDKLLDVIIKHSSGVPRTLLVNLYKCKDLKLASARAMLENTVEGVKDEVVDICRMILDPKKLKWSELMQKVDNLTKHDNPEGIRRMMFAYFAVALKNAKSNDAVFYYTAILDILDTRIEDTTQGMHGFVYLLGRIVTGVLSADEK